MNPYCTYETRFSNGFYYIGKGKSEAVMKGTYTGSGVRYKLAKMFYANSNVTSSTKLLETFATEEEAFAAEEKLVPIELLMDPHCLNETEGGRKGKYRNRSTLLKKINSEKKRATKEARLAAAREKKAKDKEKIKQLKELLKKTTK